MGAAPLLTISRNGAEIKSIPIEKESVLGRAENCVIRLEDRAISRQHAIFKPVGDSVQVEKKSEFAPLIVNGAECTRALLKEGDVIAIGPYLMKFSNHKTRPSEEGDESPSGESGAPLIDGGTQAISVLPEGENPEGLLDGESPLDLSSAGIPDSDNEPRLDLGELSGGENGSSEGASPEGIQLEGVPEALQKPEAPAESGGSQESDTGSLVEIVEDDAKTKAVSHERVGVVLVFKAGTANHTEFEVGEKEVSIGRGKQCDIVLNDKKASRKSAIITRAGGKVIIKDLESANGTYVNGTKITEQELSSGDVIRVGEVDFEVHIKSNDYSKKEKDFLPVAAEPEPSLQPEMALEAVSEPLSSSPGDFDLQLPQQDFGSPASPNAIGMAAPQAASPFMPGNGGMGGAFGIPGISGLPSGGQKATLLAKFRALPKRKQMIYGAVALALIWFLMSDDEPKKSPPKKLEAKTAASAKTEMTFENLKPEQKQFVENQHKIAFEYYKNGEYDHAIFEIQKIFTLIPDYLDSRDIERYAKEGKREKEAKEDERRKKEEEAKAKARVAELVDKARKLMNAKKYDEARDVFSEILSLDPENPAIAEWKKTIDDYEEKIRIAEQEKQVQGDINKHAWEVYADGLALKKEGKYQTAIETLTQVKDMGSTDRKVIGAAAAMIHKCRALIEAARTPVMTDAKQAEDSGDFTKAFELYEKAIKIDRDFRPAYAGADRVRGILHDRAKSLYTEAILAESYSDFSTAKKKFKECLDTTPKDDEYHDRADRKLARYFKDAVKDDN